MAGCIASALLLHGAGAGGWEWNAWRGVLEAAGIGVAAPDLLPNPQGVAATTLHDYTEQAMASLHAMPQPRAVVGASLGGLLAASVADAADALVLVNPLPPAPWHERVPRRDWPDVVPWHGEARLAGTREALPDADEASALYAFRYWRDESGGVLRAARAGIEIARPRVPILCIASEDDTDVPAAATAELALAWEATLWRLPRTSHAGPLLGRGAPALAARVARWLSRG